jgi:phage terminase small subunit
MLMTWENDRNARVYELAKMGWKDAAIILDLEININQFRELERSDEEFAKALDLGRMEYEVANNSLNERQAAFIREYLVDQNAARAAAAAGYAATTPYLASQSGQQVLKNWKVRKILNKALEARTKRVEITADRVLARLWETSELDPMDLYYADGSLKPLSEIPEDVRKHIASVKTTTRDGETFVTDLKLVDKNKARELLCKHLGILEQKLQIHHTGKVDVRHVKIDELDLSTEAKEELLKKFRERNQTLGTGAN